jgi:DNA repair protein RadA/Sms
VPSSLPSPCGLVPGSTVLVGGDPGIGKSTLLLQAAHKLAEQNRRVLYVTSEESAQQTRLRAARLGAASGQLYVLADTNLARIVEQTRRVEPQVLVIDSIQMIYKGDLPAAPGSVTQLRACCMELCYLAKASGIAVFLVGHVTKEGQLAGPRLLEHMVDTVLYFEGDRYHSHRIVRAIKNRFGTTLEVGLFEMSDGGLREVRDGGGLFAAEYRPMSGSVVCPVMQGSRCLLVEIQALTATSFPGAAKRKVSGLDSNRLAMLIAVLEKRGGLRLADQDVFTSSVGGMKIGEPAADLAIALAIAGAHLNRQVGTKARRHEGTEAKGSAGANAASTADPSCLRATVPPCLSSCAVGEIGLGGEVRHVSGIEQRIREAVRLGFTQVICPPVAMKPPAGCELLQVRTLDEALQMLH